MGVLGALTHNYVYFFYFQHDIIPSCLKEPLVIFRTHRLQTESFCFFLLSLFLAEQFVCTCLQIDKLRGWFCQCNWIKATAIRSNHVCFVIELYTPVSHPITFYHGMTNKRIMHHWVVSWEMGIRTRSLGLSNWHFICSREINICSFPFSATAR